MDSSKNKHHKASQKLRSKLDDNNRRGDDTDPLATGSGLGKSSRNVGVLQDDGSVHIVPTLLPASSSTQDSLKFQSCHVNQDAVRSAAGASNRTCPHCKKQFSKAFSISKHVDVSPH